MFCILENISNVLAQLDIILMKFILQMDIFISIFS